MSNKTNLLTGLVIGLLGVSKTAFGSELSGPGIDIQCDDETREFVLTSDNPLYSCPVNHEISSQELLQCKKIVSCMIEEGVLIDSDSLIKFGGRIEGQSTTQSVVISSCAP